MSKKVTSFLLAAAIIILNYIDYVATRQWLTLNIAAETNPIMAKAIENGNFEVKLLTVPLSMLFLVAVRVRERHEKLVDGGMYLVTAAYLILNMYHLHIYLTTNALYPILYPVRFFIGLP